MAGGRSIIAAVAALVVIGAACGDDDGDKTSASTTTSSTSSTSTTTTTTPPVTTTVPPTTTAPTPPPAANDAQAVIDAVHSWAANLQGLNLQPGDITVVPPRFSTADPSWAYTGAGPSGPGVPFQGGPIFAHNVNGTWQIIDIGTGGPGLGCGLAPDAVVAEFAAYYEGIGPC